MQDPMNTQLLLKEMELSAKNDHLLQLEEIHWAQKSREKWFNFGDKNTKYFQAMVHDRRRQNQIWRLKDDNGFWHDNHMTISNLFVKEFSDRFKSVNGQINSNVWNILVDVFTPCISDTKNADLI